MADNPPAIELIDSEPDGYCDPESGVCVLPGARAATGSGTARTADEPTQSDVSAKTVPVSSVDTLTVSTPRPNRIAAGIAVTLAEDIRSSTKPELWPAILEELRRQLGL